MTPGQEKPLFVHHTETDEHHAVVSIVVTGPFAWSQSPVDLRIVSFNEVVFGHGTLTLNGHEGQMVVTIQDNQPSGRSAIQFFDSATQEEADVPYS